MIKKSLGLFASAAACSLLLFGLALVCQYQYDLTKLIGSSPTSLSPGFLKFALGFGILGTELAFLYFLTEPINEKKSRPFFRRII